MDLNPHLKRSTEDGPVLRNGYPEGMESQSAADLAKICSPTNTDTPFKIYAGLTTIHGGLSISPILISSLLMRPQTTPATPGCLSSKQEFPNPTDHPHVDSPPSTRPAHDKIQLPISPLYKLHLLSSFPIHLIAPPLSPSPKQKEPWNHLQPLLLFHKSHPVSQSYRFYP